MTRLLYQPSTLSVMPTRQCTAQCGDCGTQSSPHVRERLTLGSILEAIEVAARQGFSVVVFTGGEATLRRSDLLAGIAAATQAGLTSRLVSNGWWGKTAKLAERTVSELKQAGLVEINFSTGDEHVKFVPLNHLFNAIGASLDHGLDPSIMIEKKAKSALSATALQKDEAFQTAIADRQDRVSLFESPWMPLDHSMVFDYPPNTLVNRENVSQRQGCDSLFSTHTIQSDGRITLCCGLGIRGIVELQAGILGEESIDFEAMAEAAEADLTKLMIREFGPERLLMRLGELEPSIQWENMYAHRCQACSRVFHDPVVTRTIDTNRNALLLEVSSNIVINQLARSSVA